MQKPSPDYDGFVSYRHDARQAGIARALQIALHRFAKPWHQLRAVRLYRDETNLAAHPDLWGVIEQALDRSRHLILIASPAAASSRWVQREVEHWLANKGAQTLFIVVTEGVIEWDAQQQCFSAKTTSLPPDALKAFAVEPFWIDLSWMDDIDEEATLDNLRFRDAVATLSSALRGVDKDVLVSEDAQHLRRRMRQAYAALGVIAILAIGAAVAAAAFFVKQKEAVQAQQLADTQRDAALSQESRAVARIAAKALDEGNPQTALLIAMEALPGPNGFGGPRPFSAEAAAVLHTALAFNRESCLLLHGGTVKLGEFRRDSGLLVTASTDGAIRIWNCEQQTAPIVNTMAHQEGLSAAGTSLDGKFLATASKNGQAKFWSVEDGHFVLLATVKVDDPVDEVYVVGNGKKVILLTEAMEHPRNAFLWETDGPAQAPKKLETTETPISIYPSPDRRLVAIGPTHGEQDNKLSVWDFSAVPARVVGARHIDSGSLTVAAFDYAGQYLFVSHAREWSRILRVDSALTEVRKFHPHDAKGITQAAAFDRTGAYLATAAQDGSLQLRHSPLAATEEQSPPQVLKGRGTGIIALVFDQQSKQMLSAAGNTATLWELNEFETRATASVSVTPATEIEQVSFDATGRKVITAATDGTARVWTSEESGLRRVPLEDKGASSRDERKFDGEFWLTVGGRFLVGKGFEPPAEVQIWDTESGKLVHQIMRPRNSAVPYDLLRVESAQDAANTTIVLYYAENWSMSTSVQILKIGATGSIDKVGMPGNLRLGIEGRILSEDGSVLVTSPSLRKPGDRDKHPLLAWNLQRPQDTPISIPAQVNMHTLRSLSPDGRVLFTAPVEEIAGISGCVWLLNATQIACMAIPRTGNAAVTAVAFNSDGTLLALADNERHVQLFSISASPKLVGAVDLADGPAKALQFDGPGRRLIINNATDDEARDSTFLWAYSRQPSTLERLPGSRAEFEPHYLDGEHLLTWGGGGMLLWDLSLEVPVAATIPSTPGGSPSAFGKRAIVFGPNSSANHKSSELVIRRVAFPDYASDLAHEARKSLVRCLTKVERVTYGLPTEHSTQAGVFLRQPDKDGGCK